MPSPRYFDQSIPFPKDVEIADIPTISLSLLKEQNEPEARRLFDACRKYGFFTLDLQDGPHENGLIRSAETLFDLATETLNLDQATLMKFACKPPKDLIGYKQAGTLKTDDGKLDTVEVYTLGQDDILGITPGRDIPDPIKQRRPQCQDFFRHAYATVSVILDVLDQCLGLSKGTLAGLCPPDQASATSLRFLLSRPPPPSSRAISFGAHTDIGLITMLFNVTGGLQILPAGAEVQDSNWRYIRPQPNCAMVNLGDTLVEWTGGILRSSLHRVVTAPGLQASVPRISLAYLIRPSYGRSIRRLNGSGIPSAQPEDEDNRTVDEWAAEHALNIMKGNMKPRTKGGISTVA